MAHRCHLPNFKQINHVSILLTWFGGSLKFNMSLNPYGTFTKFQNNTLPHTLIEIQKKNHCIVKIFLLLSTSVELMSY